MEESHNLLVSQKSSDSGLQAYLHPLVLLNISDHITRHVVRQQRGPIVGALLGQLKGRAISLEHVFECNTIIEANGDVFLNQAWFSERLQQFKDVHKTPALDLVGWFTITPTTGPTPAQLPLHRQILEHYNEAAVLLAFHASQLNNTSSTVGKLPLTIYETVYEEENPENGDRTMEVDGQSRQMTLKFRELPYSIETGEAEMIGVDSVASGGSNATAIEQKAQPEIKFNIGSKEKGPKTEAPAVSPLSREDEDLVANLTTRLGAVRTLESRLSLIKAYLQSVKSSPPDVLQYPSAPRLSYSLLRSISSLISHLTLLNPRYSNSFSVESLAQANDVALVALLSSMGESIQGMRELGKKSSLELSMRQIPQGRDPHQAMEARTREGPWLMQRGKMGGATWG